MRSSMCFCVRVCVYTQSRHQYVCFHATWAVVGCVCVCVCVWCMTYRKMPWFHGSFKILLRRCICANRDHGRWIIIIIEIKGIIATLTTRTRGWFMYCLCHGSKWYNVVCRVFMVLIVAFCFVVVRGGGMHGGGGGGGVCAKKRKREWMRRC